MAVAFSSATAQSSGTATTAPSVTLPTTAAGDLLILVRVNGGGTALAAPGGTYSGGAWSSISSGTWTTGAGDAMWSRCSGNHSGQTVTTSTTNSGASLVVRITGSNPGATPIDASTGTTLGNVAGGALTGFNTGVANTLVCYCGAVDDNQAVSAPTKNGVAMSNLSTAASSGGNDSGVWYADAAQVSAGATGNFAVTNASGGTTEGKRVIAFSIKEPIAQTVSITAATETDTAQALSYVKPIYKTLTPAAETDAAQPLQAPLVTSPDFPETTELDAFAYTENPISNGGAWDGPVKTGDGAGRTTGTVWTAGGSAQSSYRTGSAIADSEA
jgi:hypothetical protein